VPLYTADALVLRTYALGEADRLVVFLTRDRGKKRGVAKSARRPRSRFMGALEPLTEARVAYFESARRELVGLNYAETIRSPLGLASAAAQDGLTHADERLYRLGASMLEALGAGAPAEPLARYFEYWLLRLQGLYPDANESLSAGARAFLTAARTVSPHDIGMVPVDVKAVRELERVHRSLISMHLEKTLKSERVLRDLRRHA
jgi:DNA repair protein RecO (recombination protein O)